MDVRDVADAIDCDVHCAPQSYETLFPYLSDYLRQYITEAGVRLTGVAHAYPRGVVAAAPSNYEALAERVFAASSNHGALSEQALAAPAAPRIVVLNCLTGFETHRNPYFSAAVAAAINDWVREEFLARDSRLQASLVVSSVSSDDAVSEIERVGEDPRFVQVLLPVRSDLRGATRTTMPCSPRHAWLGCRSVCTRGGAPERRRRPAASPPRIWRTTWATSPSPKPRC